MKILVPVALAGLLLSPAPIRAQSTHQGQSMCREIEKTINTLTAYTHTSCSLGKGDLPGTYSLMVLSSGPVFSARSSEKRWLLVAVAAVGNALNKNSAVKGGELWLSDPDGKKNHIACTMSLQAAKSLQRRVKSHQITFKEIYSDIRRISRANRFPGAEARALLTGTFDAESRVAPRLIGTISGVDRGQNGAVPQPCC